MISIPKEQPNITQQQSPIPQPNIPSTTSQSYAEHWNKDGTCKRSKSMSVPEFEVGKESGFCLEEVSNSTGSKSVREVDRESGGMGEFEKEEIKRGFGEENNIAVGVGRVEGEGEDLERGEQEKARECCGENQSQSANSKESLLFSYLQKINHLITSTLKSPPQPPTSSLQSLFQSTINQITSLLSQNTLLSHQLQQSHKTILQSQQTISNLQRLHRQLVLQRQQLLFQTYNLHNRRNQQSHLSNSFKVQNSNLNTVVIKKIKQSKSKQLIKSNNQTIQVETFSNQQPSERYQQDDQLLSGIQKSQKTLGIRTEYNKKLQEEFQGQTIKNQRKQSDSQISHDFFFEIDKSDSRTIDTLRQRIQELQFDLNIKKDTLTAINLFVNQNIQDKSHVVDLLGNEGIKEKVGGGVIQLSYPLKLAEENAYLKKCMEKLSESDVFWMKFEEKEQKKSSENQCLLF